MFENQSFPTKEKVGVPLDILGASPWENGWKTLVELTNDPFNGSFR